MSSSFRPSPSSSASSPLSYLIARPPPAAIPPLLMGPVYGANGVPTGIGAADAAPRQGRHPPAPLPRPSPRQCPRCGSANTKFCYYNNYSRAQPRYLCKACRRHWTEGGALRDVPVGGGRKNRRSGKNSSAAAAARASSNSASAAAPASSSSDVFPEILTQVLLQPAMSAGGGGGYNIDLSAWQQVLAAPRGGDAGAAGGTAMEANCTGAGVPYWSGWLQDESMSGLDGAC